MAASLLPAVLPRSTISSACVRRDRPSSCVQPIVSAPVFSMQGFQFGALLERLREREERRFGSSGGVLVEVDEVRSLRADGSSRTG